MTNLTVALCDLKDAQKETKFENCLADVNIPVGEVFTFSEIEGDKRTFTCDRSVFKWSLL